MMRETILGSIIEPMEKRPVMKKVCSGLIIMALLSCENGSKPQPVSTVDSNIFSTIDSNPALLHIDSHTYDTNFPVALDSPVQVISRPDTSGALQD